eukprot:TRINITY_DN20504_c0_g1_i2.p1 TRINITY_DN20504_c0_g1~~TRINITY_DN20504_c0_g1_i2.p1  ORF type:complete len:177 (+),score=25.93 TRINITY_DN20504_c0_g1_i2:97-627(+)
MEPEAKNVSISTTPRRLNLEDATGILRDASLRSPRTPKKALVSLGSQITSAQGANPDFGMKDIWNLRKKQAQEWASGGDSLTAETITTGPEAQLHRSHKTMQYHLTKHIRSMRSPRDNFHNTPSMAAEIGWHLGEDGVLRAIEGTPRTFFPKTTCSMTQHMNNMYETHSENIIRRM